MEIYKLESAMRLSLLAVLLTMSCAAITAGWDSVDQAFRTMPVLDVLRMARAAVKIFEEKQVLDVRAGTRTTPAVKLMFMELLNFAGWNYYFRNRRRFRRRLESGSELRRFGH